MGGWWWWWWCVVRGAWRAGPCRAITRCLGVGVVCHLRHGRSSREVMVMVVMVLNVDRDRSVHRYLGRLERRWLCRHRGRRWWWSARLPGLQDFSPSTLGKSSELWHGNLQPMLWLWSSVVGLNRGCLGQELSRPPRWAGRPIPGLVDAGFFRPGAGRTR